MLCLEFFRYVMFFNEATFHNNGQLNQHTTVIIGPWKIHIGSVQMIINIAGVLLYGVEF